MSSTTPGGNDQGELSVGGGYVDMGMWNTNTGSSQMLCAVSSSQWSVRASMTPADFLPVQSYPANKYTYGDKALSAMSSLTSSYATTTPNVAQGSWEAAYDIWLDNTPHPEVMIWTTTSNERGATNGAHVIGQVSLGGRSYTYQNYGGFLPQFVDNTNATSGTADILGILRYLQSIGAVSSTALLREVQFGIEWCNTAGTALTFATTSFSIR